MRATPENRRIVYEAIKAYRQDTGVAVSDATLADRIGLSLEVVEACTAALCEAGVVLLFDAIPDHPLYMPVIKSDHAVPPRQPTYPTGVSSDRTSGS